MLSPASLLALMALLSWHWPIQPTHASALDPNEEQGKREPRPQPNFVLIMTDDQGDLLYDTRPEVMPALHRLLISQGQRFVNHFATTPICCPSRVSIYRGQYESNHNYTDVLGVEAGGVGGYSKFKELAVDDSYLPVWLQGLGYNTYLTGKFLVDYNVRNCHDVPKGWTDIDALVTPYLFQYFDPVFSRNGGVPHQYPGAYSTDVVATKALAQLQAAVQAGKPFFAQINPIAPHFSSGGPRSPLANGSTVPGDVSVPHYPPLPAPRHWHLFNDLEVPKPLDAFNEEDVEDKPAWIQSLPRLSRTNLTYLEEVYRMRLRSLVAVDELIERVVKQLDQLGVLDNTYVIYTSDNGYHMGTHRRATGKLSSYEEDIRVPFVIRGPDIKPGTTTLQQAAHVDIAPTLLTLAGAAAPPEIDGHPLPLAFDDLTRPSTYPENHEDAPTRSQFPITYFAGGNGDFDEYFTSAPGRVHNANWTWKSIRVHDPNSRPAPSPDSSSAKYDPDHDARGYPLQDAYKYTVICSNERELYDLKSDPHETENLLQPCEPNEALPLPRASVSDGSHTVLPLQPGGGGESKDTVVEAARRLVEGQVQLVDEAEAANKDLVVDQSAKGRRRLIQRLDVLFQVLHACWGRSCRYPFQVIHQDDATSVRNIWDALDARYDAIYDQVPPFRFLSCQRYQDYDNEVNYYRQILGTFPRGPDGKSLAPINITWAVNGSAVEITEQPSQTSNRTATCTAPTTITRDVFAWLQAHILGLCAANTSYQEPDIEELGYRSAAAQPTDDLESLAVPLAIWQINLTNAQLYGPRGASTYLA